MAASLHEELIDAVSLVLTNLALPWLGSPARIYKQKLPDVESATFPAVFLSLEGCRPELGPFSTEDDERILPVAVHLMDRSDWRDQASLSPWLEHYDTITSALLMRVFHGRGTIGNQDTPLVPGNWDNRIQAMNVLDQRAALRGAYQNAVTSFLFITSNVTARART